MEEFQGSTFIHFEKEEDDWRLMFELIIRVIIVLKKRPFRIDSFITTIFQAWHDMEYAKEQINNISF